MTTQHLSDEAVAAHADNVLSGAARTRAARHTAECPECAHAVAVQREAVWALRSAPAPALPTGLLDRLRSVPAQTPISSAPSAMGADGSPLFPAFGAMAAFIPDAPVRARPQADATRNLGAPQDQPSTQHGHRGRRMRPFVLTAAAVAAAGAVAMGAAGAAAGQHRTPQPGSPGSGSTGLVRYQAPAIAPADAGH